ncbi:hypothetical protein THRCLA_07238 [Thraustotheca clavata]|uniref:Protein preY, mitochondrial n=1 Tax=Thraustotheca clavata TaxID=74557 RepID=A0A1V9ZF15_9STRA|nr:hypothetical protein THRCLA_07238 [Thraustotheca clavata]
MPGKRAKTDELKLEQCRINQRRYRSKVQASQLNLEAKVNHLVIETARLEGRLEIFRSKMLPIIPRAIEQSSGLQIAREYFTLFQHGFPDIVLERDSVAPDSPHQLFLKSTFSPTFLFLDDNVNGLALYLKQWRRYCTYFSRFEMVCHNYQVVKNEDDEEFIHCIGNLHLRLSRNTFTHVFPNVLSNEPLVQQLIGKELLVPFAIRLSLKNGQIQMFECDAEFTLGLVNLIKNLALAADIMAHANLNGSELRGTEHPSVTIFLTPILMRTIQRFCARAFSSKALVSPSVLKHLVCPISKYPLEYLETHGVVFCREIRVAYPIRDGIPILVPTEGRIVPDDEEL